MAVNNATTTVCGLPC